MDSRRNILPHHISLVKIPMLSSSMLIIKWAFFLSFSVLILESLDPKFSHIFHSCSHTKITTSSILIALSSSLGFCFNFVCIIGKLELHHLERKEGHGSYKWKRGFLTLCCFLYLLGFHGRLEGVSIWWLSLWFSHSMLNINPFSMSYTLFYSWEFWHSFLDLSFQHFFIGSGGH